MSTSTSSIVVLVQVVVFSVYILHNIPVIIIVQHAVDFRFSIVEQTKKHIARLVRTCKIPLVFGAVSEIGHDSNKSPHDQWMDRHVCLTTRVLNKFICIGK